LDEAFSNLESRKNEATLHFADYTIFAILSRDSAIAFASLDRAFSKKPENAAPVKRMRGKR
jgi:hypothetical protein